MIEIVRTLQKNFRSLEKTGLLLQTSKNKHTTRYAISLISSARSFTDTYTLLNLDYLESHYMMFKQRQLKSI